MRFKNVIDVFNKNKVSVQLLEYPLGFLCDLIVSYTSFH